VAPDVEPTLRTSVILDTFAIVISTSYFGGKMRKAKPINLKIATYVHCAAALGPGHVTQISGQKVTDQGH